MTRALLSLFLLLGACAAPVGASDPAPPSGVSGGGADNGNGPPERVFGTIAFHDEPATVGVPETVAAGETFSVRVLTYGDPCFEPGETDVRLEANRAEIRPYDYNIAPGQGCPAELRTFEHTATVVFTKAGEAEVIVFGQSVRDDVTTNTSVTRTVTVR